MNGLTGRGKVLGTLIAVLAVMHGAVPCSHALIIIRDRTGNIVPGATSISLAELTNALASIQIDDKLFESWRNFTSVATGGAVPVNAALVTVVTTSEGTCDPGPGVRLASPQFSVGGIAQSQRTMFSYNVRTVSGAPRINGVTLGLAAFQADLAGEINVTETVRDQNQILITNLAVHVTSFDVSPPTGTDQASLAPPRSVVSVTKDILLSNGGPEDQGSASLTNVTQNFSQVCAPAIQVSKKIACLPCTPGVSCQTLATGAYSGSALGYKSDTASPIFCYSITITN